LKKILLIAGLVILIGTGAYGLYRLSNSMTIKIMLQSSGMEDRNFEPVLGVIDGQNLQLPAKSNWHHLALVLNNDPEWKIEDNLLKDIPVNEPVLLTVEMWDSSVLSKFATGKYDENIRQLFSQILNSDHIIFLRWNPEMEVPAGVYAWESIPHLYIESFKRFSEIIKEISPTTKMVFGPAGYPGALESYPGAELVDAVSITLNSRSERDIPTYKEKDLETQLYRKLHRLRFVDHPIFILGSRDAKPEIINSTFIENAVLRTAELVIKLSFENRNELDEGTPLMIGVYDPKEVFVNEGAVSIEHIFISLHGILTGEFELSLKKILERKNDLIISVEPGMNNHEVGNEEVLEDIINGKYDEIITRFYKILAGIDRTLYLRIAHEMEIPVDRYAWQNKDPQTYIKAYRYFMKFPGSEMDNLKRIWGPAGDRGSLEYWPGADVVDYISISVYGLPDKNITDPEKQETFDQIVRRKSWRMRFVNKPYFITEFGVMGDEDFQTQWLEEAAMVLNNNPQIVGVNYFNNEDVPEAWGEIKPPQWSISKNTFHHFIEKLER
jgi:beta-mannanase